MYSDKVTPSPGQQRVQQVAAQMLHEAAVDLRLLEAEGPGELICRAFLDRLADDPIVRDDLLLAEPILTSKVARSYVAWLSATSVGKLKLPPEQVVLDFGRMEFNGSCIPQDPKNYGRKVYEGGAKRPSTSARAVLTLAAGGTVPGLCVSYFASSRVTQGGNDGNHRLLACKMLGHATLANIAPKTLTVYDDRPDEALNRALLYFEALHPHSNPWETQWEMRDIVGYEARLPDLAAAYQRCAVDDERNELIAFTQHDLTSPEGAKKGVYSIEDNGPYSKPRLPELLQDYLAVYAHLTAQLPQAPWFDRLLCREQKTTLLTPKQQETKSRWEQWRRRQKPGMATPAE